MALECNQSTILASIEQAGTQARSMTFGEKVRGLRQAKQLTLRDLAAKVGVGFTYLSKIENHKLEDGHSPSEKLIHKLATELNASEDELLLLAEKVPEPIRKRFRNVPRYS